MKFRVAEYRKKLHMTQAELSEKSGVSRTIISGLESGTLTNAKADTLCKLADALGVKVSKLFFD